MDCLSFNHMMCLVLKQSDYLLITPVWLFDKRSYARLMLHKSDNWLNLRQFDILFVSRDNEHYQWSSS